MAKVIFLHLFVILFTGGVCLNACWDTTPPRNRPPRADPLGSRPPWSRLPPPGADPPRTDTPRDQTPPRTRPPRADNPPPPPREADSSIRSMSGRYASYWNAFLLCLQPTLRLRFSFPVVFNNAKLCSHPAPAKVISPIKGTQPIFQAKSLSLGLKIKCQKQQPDWCDVAFTFVFIWYEPN